MRHLRDRIWKEARGFALIELVVVVLIIGVLVGIGIPNYKRSRDNAKVAVTAVELKTIASGFIAYVALYHVYPPDSHEFLPPGMSDFIDPVMWVEETPLGGHYNWEGPDSYPYAGVSIFEPTAESHLIVALDAMLDDGNLATGNFRLGTNGRPTLIIDENP